MALKLTTPCVLASTATAAAVAILTAASVAAAGVAAAGAANATSAAAASTLVISGAGDGHGVGMSQDGALGDAEHGWSYQAILAHYYQHTALGTAARGTVVKVLVGARVKRVPLEAYVRGVVAAEMPASWPPAALEAQAVASRTYALTAHAGGSRFDVYSDTRSQMYRGKAAETPSTNAAVAATAGQIVTYAGKPAITYFCADSGGHTESVQYGFPGSAPEPWLVGVADPYDAGPQSRWRVQMSFAAAARRLTGLVRGSFRGVEVTRRGSSPRIVAADLVGSRGRTPVSGPELAERFGLASTWAYFSVHDSHGAHPGPHRSGGSPRAPASGAPAAAVTGAGGSPAAPSASGPTPSGDTGGVSADG